MAKYIFLSSTLFIIAMLGLFLARKHLIIILMALEILLLAANINFVIFSVLYVDVVGQIYSLIILTLGAAESAIGLAITIVYFRLRGSVQVDTIKKLKDKIIGFL